MKKLIAAITIITILTIVIANGSTLFLNVKNDLKIENKYTHIQQF